ncbi:MAG TPA: toll/interleukin-1 receptor domain-containing protein [Thermoanaerobaculia bacterium]
MREKDWRTLLHTLRQGNCILVLGPEIPCPRLDETPALGPDGKAVPFFQEEPTLPATLAMSLAAEATFTQSLDPRDLAQVAELYSMQFGRNDLEAEVVSFYRRAPASAVYADLAKVPFNLVISLAHDSGLADALRQEGKEPVAEVFDFRGDQKDMVGLGRGDVGTARSPLVYYLYGHVDVPRSLVISESDTLDFLSAVMAKSPDLPGDLRSHLRDPNKSFLLLGFGLARWYLRILLHLLKVNKKESRSFAFEHIGNPETPFVKQTILFLRKGLKVESHDVDVTAFCGELRRRVEEAGLGTEIEHAPRPAAPPMGPKVFISYASEDEAHARKLYEALKADGFDPWYDKEGLRGGDRWGDVIPDALERVDYVVVVQSRALGEKTFSYVNKEIDMALQRQQLARRGIRFIIPVRVDDGPLLDDLKHLQTLDLRGAEGTRELASVIARDQQRRKRRD